MERYEQAVAAFAKAVELNPGSDELKRSYEAAKAKTAEGGKTEGASALQPETASNGGGGLNVAASEAMPPPEHGAAIRSMVDGLAARLESSPRDIEGWTSLMRSRVVLGES
jgi:cytochrome c-type biogenesis protein CcmH